MIEFFTLHKSWIVMAHAFFAAIGLGAVLVTDTLFFRFLKDLKISAKEHDTLEAISSVVWVVIMFLFLTGLALYMSAPLDYLEKSKFIAKIVVFAVVVANGVFLNLLISPHLRKISFGAVKIQPSLRMRVLRRLAFASGAVSMVSWIAVFFLGSLRALPFSAGEILLGYAAVTLVAVIGSQLYASYLKYCAH